jgi:hypothetical protein
MRRRRCAAGRAGRGEAEASAGRPAFPDDRAQPAAGTRTVLVIEDDPDFARILYSLAHDMEFRCLVAHRPRRPGTGGEPKARTRSCSTSACRTIPACRCCSS